MLKGDTLYTLEPNGGRFFEVDAARRAGGAGKRADPLPL
jgi:hypothetical protein